MCFFRLQYFLSTNEWYLIGSENSIHNQTIDLKQLVFIIQLIMQLNISAHHLQIIHGI